MNSIAWGLSKLRLPLKPELGGVAPGYIDGLNWRWTADGVITVDSGAAWCPYDTGGRVVVVPAPIAVTVPNGTAAGRTHLWLHADAGTPVIVTDEAGLTDNYFGDAFRHPVNKGWRYLGSLLRNGAGGIYPQTCANNYVAFLVHVGQTPFEIVSSAAQVAARTVNLNPVCPPNSTAVVLYAAAGTAALRLAATSANAGGNTVSVAWFTHVVQGATYMVFEATVGRDNTLQYMNDAAGGNNVIRCTGYRFRR